MTIRRVFAAIMGGDKLVALFGEARLVKTASGSYELRGGTTGDRTAAQEWISLFMHDAVISQGLRLRRVTPG